jgi:TfoX/Sxy family transcriptional regulator of competence genes
MATEYLEKLSRLVHELGIENEFDGPVEVKHFFSGAALYIDKTMYVSWSPAGLAFKLPEPEVSKLIDSGMAKPLKYFPKGNVKKGYALFEDPDPENLNLWKPYFLMSGNPNR